MLKKYLKIIFFSSLLLFSIIMGIVILLILNADSEIKTEETRTVNKNNYISNVEARKCLLTGKKSVDILEKSLVDQTKQYHDLIAITDELLNELPKIQNCSDIVSITSNLNNIKSELQSIGAGIGQIDNNVKQIKVQQLAQNDTTIIFSLTEQPANRYNPFIRQSIKAWSQAIEDLSSKQEANIKNQLSKQDILLTKFMNKIYLEKVRNTPEVQTFVDSFYYKYFKQCRIITATGQKAKDTLDEVFKIFEGIDSEQFHGNYYLGRIDSLLDFIKYLEKNLGEATNFFNINIAQDEKRITECKKNLATFKQTFKLKKIFKGAETELANSNMGIDTISVTDKLEMNTKFTFINSITAHNFELVNIRNLLNLLLTFENVQNMVYLYTRPPKFDLHEHYNICNLYFDKLDLKKNINVALNELKTAIANNNVQLATNFSLGMGKDYLNYILFLYGIQARVNTKDEFMHSFYNNTVYNMNQSNYNLLGRKTYIKWMVDFLLETQLEKNDSYLQKFFLKIFEKIKNADSTNLIHVTNIFKFIMKYNIDTKMSTIDERTLDIDAIDEMIEVLINSICIPYDLIENFLEEIRSYTEFFIDSIKTFDLKTKMDFFMGMYSIYKIILTNVIDNNSENSLIKPVFTFIHTLKNNFSRFNVGANEFLDKIEEMQSLLKILAL